MLDDLLEVGRVLSGKVQLSPRSINLAELVRDALAAIDLTGQLREHRVETELRDIWVRVDATRLEQVVANLVGNAAQYTPAGSGIRVEVGECAGDAQLVVQDDGPGIPTELLPRIFDLFAQGTRPMDRRSGGLGIGLTMVKRLVELHGGTVTIESLPRGSRFTVRLPALEMRPDESGPVPLLEVSQQRVVVVEDNTDALISLRSLLELDGHTVHWATDGESGLALMLQDRPDVGIVDIGLPGLNGYEVAERARAAGYAGILVALTGYGQVRDAKASLAAGFDAHLVKPVDLRRLREIMATA
jgi:CheY-like chemotaxis protein/anti-sigma regulatory factor (Ser/Thr protein kinase)